MELNSNSAIDLSIRPTSQQSNKSDQVPIVRPIPRLPWTITWYQRMWADNHSHVINSCRGRVNPYLTPQASHKATFTVSAPEGSCFNSKPIQSTSSETISKPPLQKCISSESENKPFEQDSTEFEGNGSTLSTVLDIACCDGPVVFERVSNPNFALTVEHRESATDWSNKMQNRRHLALKTYVCIYCNQSFKSLFCYQKHKKRHLNPVSVDITATHDALKQNCAENKAKTKDLNVQFFPCKKCGCKFPSYYFVHKHRKVCNALDTGSN